MSCVYLTLWTFFGMCVYHIYTMYLSPYSRYRNIPSQGPLGLPFLNQWFKDMIQELHASESSEVGTGDTYKLRASLKKNLG